MNPNQSTLALYVGTAGLTFIALFLFIAAIGTDNRAKRAVTAVLAIVAMAAAAIIYLNAGA